MSGNCESVEYENYLCHLQTTIHRHVIFITIANHRKSMLLDICTPTVVTIGRTAVRIHQRRQAIDQGGAA